MDKTKIIEGAAKLVAKGAFEKAAREYQKVLDVDPRDMRVLQKMGELYRKKGENAQAASFFIRVAEVYAQDGFFLKAVALFKQVLKLNPDLAEVNVNLAELHQQLGLMTEAMAFFQVVVGYHERRGDSKATFATLKKMVDLDPENVSSRLKLAELYAREQMGGEALGEFRHAADWLERNNRPDERLRVLERIAALEPDNIQLAKDLARDYLARGDQKRALAKLQLCFKADPRDIPTLLLLAQAFTALNHTSKTLSVYKELAGLYEQRGQLAEAREAWAKVERLDPRDADLAAYRASGSPAASGSHPRSAPHPAPGPYRTAPPPSSAVAAPLPRRPTPTPAPPPPVAATAVSLTGEQLHKLLAETDVYVKYGLHDKALEHLRRVFAVDPENLDAHEKAYLIYRSANQGPQTTEQLLNVLRLCTRGLEVERAQPYLDTLLAEAPHHPEMAAFLAVLRPDEARGGGDAALLTTSGDEEVLLADDPAGAGSDDLALRSAGVIPSDDGELLADGDASGFLDVQAGAELDEPITGQHPARRGEPVIVPPPPESSTGLEAYDLGDYGEAVPFDEDPSPVTEVTEALGAYEAGVESAVELPPDEEISLTPSPLTPAPLTPAPAPPQTATARPSAPLGPAAFAPARGPATAPQFKPGSASAPSGLATPGIPTSSPPSAPGLLNPGAVASASPSSAPLFTRAPSAATARAVLIPPAPESAEPARHTPRPSPPEESAPVTEELNEASFFLDQGLLEEAREILETVDLVRPGLPRTAALQERLRALEADRLAAPPTPAPPRVPDRVAPPGVDPIPVRTGSYNLADELADELSDLGAEPAPPEPSHDLQYSVEEVFSEFKRGLARVVPTNDVDTHYDLGIAYKEMGLLDDAVQVFEVARQGCQGRPKELDCLTMIGMLQGMRGDWGKAVSAYREALGTAHAAEREMSLRYDLAQAYESAGAPGKALSEYLAVQRAEPNHRDVVARVERLAATVSPEPNGSSRPVASRPIPPAGAEPAAPPAAKSRKVGYL
jgi:pilus assembly protein FimV